MSSIIPAWWNKRIRFHPVQSLIRPKEWKRILRFIVLKMYWPDTRIFIGRTRPETNGLPTICTERNNRQVTIILQVARLEVTETVTDGNGLLYFRG